MKAMVIFYWSLMYNGQKDLIKIMLKIKLTQVPKITFLEIKIF